MTWNYRIFHRSVEVPGLDEPQDEFTIREAYYEDGTDKVVISFTAEPSWPGGETREELKMDLHAMMAALLQDVIELTPDGENLAR